MFKSISTTLVSSALFAFSTMASADIATSPQLQSALLQEESTEQEWRFRVMLGKKEIGFHEFRVNRQGEQTEVEISAQFDVKVLFINAYSYTHENEELWDDNCLSRIQSFTDDNGESNTVLGEIGIDGFVVKTPAERVEEESSCIRSFAYWNPAFLDSTRLLNSQTGEIVDVEISRVGNDSVDVSGEPVAATRYAVKTEDGTISLWYSRENGQWLALEAPTPGGRVLRYEPVALPFRTPVTENLAQY